jgi:hypothetical protein
VTAPGEQLHAWREAAREDARQAAESIHQAHVAEWRAAVTEAQQAASQPRQVFTVGG